MSSNYNDSNERLARESILDAPEAANRLTPLASRTSIDNELRQYPMRSSQWLASPMDLDTDKEVVALPMDSVSPTYPHSTNSPARHAVSPVATMAAMSPTSIWRPATADILPLSSRGASASTARSDYASIGEEDVIMNRDNENDQVVDGYEDEDEHRGGTQRASPANPNENEQRKIMGMRRKVFWIVLAVLALILVLAAIAGGIGSLLASKASKNKN
ncbi:hypothetical protein E4U54_004041, partial [Claviceps lovelessii]